MSVSFRFVLAVVLSGISIPGFCQDTQSASLAGREFTLVIPEGMCFLDEGFEWDRNDLALQRKTDAGTNVTFVGMAECGQLRDIRAGNLTRLSKFGYVKSPLPNMGNQPVDMPRQEFLKEIDQMLRSQGAKLLEEAEGRMKDKIAEERLAIEMGGMTNLGILYREPDMLGFLMMIRIVKGAEAIDRLAAVGMTLLNGIPITMNLYMEDEAPSTIDELTTMSKEAMTKLVAQNP